MATEFLRLYNEMCRGDRVVLDTGRGIKKLEEDEEDGTSESQTMYVSTRTSVMTRLGYDLGEKAFVRTKPHKYHGKAARRAAELKLTEPEGGRSKSKGKGGGKVEALKGREKADARKKLNELMVETDRINKVAREIQEAVTNGESIGERLVQKLANSKQKHESTYKKKLPPLTHQENHARELSVVRRDHSKFKWSPEERDRMNSLYHEIAKPSSSFLGAWQQYYKGFAERFRSVCPQRSETEVIAKLQTMILKRQMQAESEKSFWKDVHDGTGDYFARPRIEQAEFMGKKTPIKTTFPKEQRFSKVSTFRR